MDNHSLAPIGGSIVLFGIATKLPAADGLIAGVAAFGLFLTGLANLLKQASELLRRDREPRAEAKGSD